MKIAKHKLIEIIKEEVIRLKEGFIGDDEGHYESLQGALNDVAGSIRARYDDDKELRAALGAVFARMEELERDRDRALDAEDERLSDEWDAK